MYAYRNSQPSVDSEPDEEEQPHPPQATPEQVFAEVLTLSLFRKWLVKRERAVFLFDGPSLFAQYLQDVVGNCPWSKEELEATVATFTPPWWVVAFHDWASITKAVIGVPLYTGALALSYLDFLEAHPETIARYQDMTVSYAADRKAR